MGVDAATPEIEVTVIGGYLGAGKTTLLNHILRHTDERVAILVNDFGDINIDEDLIVSHDGDTISLSNGCICCSLVDGFAAAIATVRALDPAPARLVIEASGVADPATVAAYGHGPGLRLDATLVVADAETIQAKSTDVYVGDAVLAQLRSGAIIVLNKADLVTVERLSQTRAWLQHIAPDAVVVDAVNAVVEPSLLFGVGGVGVDREPGPAGPADADSRYESRSWTGDDPVERARVEELMAVLPDGVVRAKGVFFLSEDPDRAMVLQRVGRRWTLSRRLGRPSTQRSRLVLIGLRGTLSDARVVQALDALDG